MPRTLPRLPMLLLSALTLIAVFAATAFADSPRQKQRPDVNGYMRRAFRVVKNKR